jgi:hypothetical protein
MVPLFKELKEAIGKKNVYIPPLKRVLKGLGVLQWIRYQLRLHLSNKCFLDRLVFLHGLRVMHKWIKISLQVMYEFVDIHQGS